MKQRSHHAKNLPPIHKIMKLLSQFRVLLASMALAATSLSAQPSMQLGADLAHPNVQADKKTTTYIRALLTGADGIQMEKRKPVNVAIVIDKSGSMNGERIVHARQAAIRAIDLLSAEDVVSVIAYDSKVHVIYPASKLGDANAVKKAIENINADGNTALFAGVSKASEELRKFKQEDQVNRIVLLSDGMANVGPDSPEELGRLGTALAKESISVTTLGLGLGYNEDLMTELALRSDGNHAFIKDSEALASVFENEFGDLMSVVAQRLQLKITCGEGVRPVRTLGLEADIKGQEVVYSFNQLYAKQQRSLLLEVELPPGKVDTDVLVAGVSVTYFDAAANKDESVITRSVARRVDDETRIGASLNKEVMEEVAVMIATEKEALAVKLSDEGRHAEALKALNDNAAWTASQAAILNSDKLNTINLGQVERQTKFKEGGSSANEARKMSKELDFSNRSKNSIPSKK